MKICFCGLGSIGLRHLRNITTILSERNEKFIIDAFRSRRVQLNPKDLALISQQFYDIDDLPKDYDIAFICTPTSNHYSDILKLQSHAKKLFVEKPVFQNIEDISKIDRIDDIYVACPLRYTLVLQYVKKIILEEKVYSSRAICSTYLPNWRPEVDYRTVYSAHKEMGGGVSIDLIHEWDYLSWLFGMPSSVCNMKGHFSNLEIDSDDLSLYIATYKDKLLSLYLDYFGRYEKREIELFTSNDTIVADIKNSQIRFMNQNRVINFKEERNNYQINELVHFLDITSGRASNDNNLAHALKVLKIAKGEWL